MKVLRRGLTGYAELSPENDTRYQATATVWPYGHDTIERNFGSLGMVNDGWLVVSGIESRAHLFQLTGVLTQGYVEEKLKLNREDGFYMTVLLGILLGRETRVRKEGG